MKDAKPNVAPLLLLWTCIFAFMTTVQAQEMPEPDQFRPPTEENCENIEEPPHENIDSPHTERWLERIRKKNPEEYQRLTQLRETDPRSFHNELANKLMQSRIQRGFRNHPRLKEFFDSLPPHEQQAIAQTFFMREGKQHKQGRHRRGSKTERKNERPPLDQKTSKLLQQYRATDNAEEKDSLKTQIMEELQLEFDKRTQSRRRSIAQLEKKLDRFQERLAKREANRDTIIQHRFEQLTCEEALKW